MVVRALRVIALVFELAEAIDQAARAPLRESFFSSTIAQPVDLAIERADVFERPVTSSPRHRHSRAGPGRSGGRCRHRSHRRIRRSGTRDTERRSARGPARGPASQALAIRRHARPWRRPWSAGSGIPRAGPFAPSRMPTSSQFADEAFVLRKAGAAAQRGEQRRAARRLTSRPGSMAANLGQRGLNRRLNGRHAATSQTGCAVLALDGEQRGARGKPVAVRPMAARSGQVCRLRPDAGSTGTACARRA